jgi:hypothetical protein
MRLRLHIALATCGALLGNSSWLMAQTTDAPAQPQEESAEKKFEKSPWLLAPVFNVNPKLGAAVGALGGYVHYFDEKSRPSIFALMGQYSNTGSTIAGLNARTSFDEDRQRLLLGMVYGYVKNDYGDYLGTGVPLQTNAEVRGFLGRYLYRVKDDWFVGVQGMYQNFDINGETQLDDQVMNILGLKPNTNAGVGLSVQHDSRDNENMPHEGWLLNVNNMAYRESLGGNSNFDLVRIDFRYFIDQGKGNVFAIRQLNHLTSDAPTASHAPVQLRGYKIGQYTGDYMSSIEGEERLRLGEKWTGTLFAGVACVYGGSQTCERQNLYPSVGGGVQYVLKPKEGIVMNLEYAQGKDGNYGVYLKLGYQY